MDALVAVSLAYPTVVWSFLSVISLLYWITVLLGFAGGDSADGAAEGAADGAAEGAADGAAEGAADGAAEGAADGAAEGAGDGAAEGGADALDVAGSGLALLAGFQRSRAPVTLKFSLLFLISWVLSQYASQYGGPALSALMPRALWGTALLVLCPLLAMPLTGLLLRPLAGLFVTHAAKRRAHLIGQVVEVTTGRVDRGFGQASLEAGGANLLLQVRCEPSRGIKRGDRVLLLSYDETQEAYEVEPFDDMLERS